MISRDMFGIQPWSWLYSNIFCKHCVQFLFAEIIIISLEAAEHLLIVHPFGRNVLGSFKIFGKRQFLRFRRKTFNKPAQQSFYIFS